MQAYTSTLDEYWLGHDGGWYILVGPLPAMDISPAELRPSLGGHMDTMNALFYNDLYQLKLFAKL